MIAIRHQRTVRIGTILFLFAIASCAVCSAREHTRAELIQRAEQAKVDDQPKAYTDVAELQLHQADKDYKAGNSYGARAAVQDVATFSSKAVDAALRSGKQLKKTEIKLRKMQEKLRDIKRTVEYDDQAPIQSVIDQLEGLRNHLLEKMFHQKSK